MMKFRQSLIEIANVDPLSECSTIASVAMKVYQRNFMPKNTIPILPPAGYNAKEKQSREALIWLKYIEASEGIDLVYAGKPKEHRIEGGVKLDGYCAATNTAYEYEGCWIHGCPKCFKDRTFFNPLLRNTMEELFQATIAREEFIRSKGYNLVVIWGCEWRAKLMEPNVKQIASEIPMRRPLDPREALRGGRTEVGMTYFKAKHAGEKLCYVVSTCIFGA